MKEYSISIWLWFGEVLTTSKSNWYILLKKILSDVLESERKANIERVHSLKRRSVHSDFSWTKGNQNCEYINIHETPIRRGNEREWMPLHIPSKILMEGGVDQCVKILHSSTSYDWPKTPGSIESCFRSGDNSLFFSWTPCTKPFFGYTFLTRLARRAFANFDFKELKNEKESGKVDVKASILRWEWTA